ncbi:MAG: hypothetical protein QW112_01280 [Candidatus Micrarchaeia archaeon]
MAKKIAKIPRESHKKKWWYNIGLVILICVFLLFMDYATAGTLTWSIWPVIAIFIFGIGFSAIEMFKKQRPVWYDIAMTILICAFILIVDISTTGMLTWSKWPAVAIFIFGIGFVVLERIGRE